MATLTNVQLYNLSQDELLPIIEVIDNLTSDDTTKPLSAYQGKVLKGLVDTLSGISSFSTEVVTELPSTGTNGVLYLKLSDNGGTSNIYDEYIWVTSTSTFEKLGVFVDVDNINNSISTLQDTVSTLQSTISELQNAVTTINNNISSIQTDLSSVTTTVNSINADFGNLVTNVQTLQTSVSTNTTNISTINSTIEDIQSDIEDITPPTGYELVMIAKN